MRTRMFTETVEHRNRVYVVTAQRGRGSHAVSVICGTVERKFRVTARFGAATRCKAIEIYEGMEAMG